LNFSMDNGKVKTDLKQIAQKYRCPLNIIFQQRSLNRKVANSKL